MCYEAGIYQCLELRMEVNTTRGIFEWIITHRNYLKP